MNKKYLVLGLVSSIIVSSAGWYIHQKSMNKYTHTLDKKHIVLRDQVEYQNMKKLIFNTKEYTIGDVLPATKDTDFIPESYEWVTGGETVDSWTTLITTHLLTPNDSSVPLVAEAYAQNVASLQNDAGALTLETSVINQDLEALGIDPARPPFLLVYMYSQGDTTEFNTQKIVQLENGKVGSIIYAERFLTKSEDDMKAYYESAERTAKREELIKMKFAY